MEIPSDGWDFVIMRMLCIIMMMFSVHRRSFRLGFRWKKAQTECMTTALCLKLHTFLSNSTNYHFLFWALYVYQYPPEMESTFPLKNTRRKNNAQKIYAPKNFDLFVLQCKDSNEHVLLSCCNRWQRSKHRTELFRLALTRNGWISLWIPSQKTHFILFASLNSLKKLNPNYYDWRKHELMKHTGTFSIFNTRNVLHRVESQT